jgi:hypothetical protein
MTSLHFMTSAQDHFARFCYSIEKGGLNTAVLAAHEAGNAELKAISEGLIRNCHILEIRMEVVLFGSVLAATRPFKDTHRPLRPRYYRLNVLW